jgi:hypothetical protein
MTMRAPAAAREQERTDIYAGLWIQTKERWFDNRLSEQTHLPSSAPTPQLSV